jgi:DNA-binding transcriptional regulator YdaS (Cro superfamily)
MLLSTWLSGRRGRSVVLARHLKIPPSMVTKMAAGEKQVPLDHCPFIQDFTGSAVTCEELRPDQAAYFALIRAQVAASGAVPAEGPPPLSTDRRSDAATAALYTNTLADRRAPTAVAERPLAANERRQLSLPFNRRRSVRREGD